jgi:hypothetical protein
MMMSSDSMAGIAPIPSPGHGRRHGAVMSLLNTNSGENGGAEMRE